MDKAHYWHQYNLLRRNAKDWNIDYARYTHDQLRHAIELNQGIVDASLRKRLLGIPPANAYHAAVSSGKVERHEPLHGTAIQKAEPMPDPQRSASSLKKKSTEIAAFPLPAPKEAFPWASVSL